MEKLLLPENHSQLNNRKFERKVFNQPEFFKKILKSANYAELEYQIWQYF
jgi:hypothetical protein